MERNTIENKFKWTIDEMYPNENIGQSPDFIFLLKFIISLSHNFPFFVLNVSITYMSFINFLISNSSP